MTIHLLQVVKQIIKELSTIQDETLNNEMEDGVEKFINSVGQSGAGGKFKGIRSYNNNIYIYIIHL